MGPVPLNEALAGEGEVDFVFGGSPLEAGAKLGRYRIVAPLGAGGMGVVYRGEDEKLERSVAIKILAPGVLGTAEARRRFQREARALAKLSHPHIATIYDVGEQDGTDYIVMECITGESLDAKLAAGPLSIRDATSITLQIAEALDEAHAQGIVHRDLKPQNVMITTRGQVKVLDFGIAKLLEASPTDATVSVATQGLVGTPLYMSPEQAREQPVDSRTDLWSLGIIYREVLTGTTPFQGGSYISTLRSIAEETPAPIEELRPDAPKLCREIASRCLEKDVKDRYQTAAEIVRDASLLLAQLTNPPQVNQAVEVHRARISRRQIVLVSLVSLVSLIVIAVGGWFYHRSTQRLWAKEEAVPKINTLLAGKRSLAAFLLLQKAEKYLPSDPQIRQLSDENTLLASITSEPSGATVEIQDYAADAPFYRLGVTPLPQVRIPKGYFRWKISKPGVGEAISAPFTREKMNFGLDEVVKAPSGMVPVPSYRYMDFVSFIGWVGPYDLPAYYVDRYEVTNRSYQQFVDSGGYQKAQFWHEAFEKDGRTRSFEDAMTLFRDTTGRPGPSTWVGGHYPEGAADLPVSGVSWYEASAYAVFAGKQLPVLTQWLQIAPGDLTPYVVSKSNFSGEGLTPGGQSKGVGPYGTYDTAGNVREWVGNTVDGQLRFILGGAWKSPSYLYSSPEAASPFDRSDTNGFRCVKNLTPLPNATAQPVRRMARDFSSFTPAPDPVFQAYKLLYAYPASSLNVKEDGVVKETVDWREERVTFDAGYRGERMSAYLFLPKNTRPPYQTVLFFPSARVLSLSDSHGGRELGDIKFFDYILQSGRAVMYPIYEDTYERRLNFDLPSASQSFELTVDRYKDAARSLDYLTTRTDIDSSRIAYLGVSMGSAEGVIVTALLQDRLKSAIFLDGGYFLDPPVPGGDQADFAPRIKKPVLMVNGRYDFTFPVDKAQNPLFDMLGTPAQDKSHVILETPHDVTEQRPQLTKAVLDWLDRYLGRVN